MPAARRATEFAADEAAATMWAWEECRSVAQVRCRPLWAHVVHSPAHGRSRAQATKQAHVHTQAPTHALSRAPKASTGARALSSSRTHMRLHVHAHPPTTTTHTRSLHRRKASSLAVLLPQCQLPLPPSHAPQEGVWHRVTALLAPDAARRTSASGVPRPGRASTTLDGQGTAGSPASAVKPAGASGRGASPSPMGPARRAGVSMGMSTPPLPAGEAGAAEGGKGGAFSGVRVARGNRARGFKRRGGGGGGGGGGWVGGWVGGGEVGLFVGCGA